MTNGPRESVGNDRPRTALVVSGGGARGAYQVGVLRGLMDLGVLPSVDVLVGSSAGAINAGMLAAHADNFEKGVAALERIWGQIKPQQVFRTDLRSLGGIGIKWAWDLSFGGALRHVQPKFLLDTAPLRRLLKAKIPFKRIQPNIENGSLYAFTVVATDLYTSNGVIFLHGHPDIPLWKRGRWVIDRTQIGVDQIMASSAIPIFFPSVEIDGRYFGDGSIRNTAPLSPAINLGADRIIAISVREAGAPTQATGPAPQPPPTIAQIAGVLLDAVMLDAIEVDVEHSERVNTSVRNSIAFDPRNPFRPVEVLWLSPRRQFTEIAAELSSRIPRIVRYLMRGLGDDQTTIELASYLLFDSEFCGRLMELGRQDVESGRERIERFFAGAMEGATRADGSASQA